MNREILKKTLMTLILACGVLLCASHCNAAEALCNVKYEEAQRELKIPDEYLVKYTTQQKNTLQIAKQLEDADGKACAEMLNKIQDQECYRNAVKEVLDDYFSQDKPNIRQDDFIEHLKKSALDIVQDYEEAKKERDSYKKLDYNPKKILLTLKYEISDTSILNAMEKISDGGKVIDLAGKQIDTLQINERSRLNDLVKNLGYKYAVVDVGIGQTVQDAVDAYRGIDGIISVERDWYLTQDSTAFSNDIYANKKWEYEHTELNKAWMLSYQYNSNASVRVAVLDTGMDTNREDLQGQYIDAYSVDITKNMKSLSKCDVKDADVGDAINIGGHGTGVASVINACKDNGKGIAGVTANNCRLMAIKIADDENVKTISALCDGIAYAMLNGAKVINMSVGGYGNSSETETLQRVIKSAHDYGVVLVASAGNGKRTNAVGDTDFHYPSDMDGVIGVIATTKENKRRRDSNYGFNKDVCAPGDEIYCAYPNNKYVMRSGTSFASPFVSGVVALMLKVNPQLTPDQVDSIIKGTATDIGAVGRDEETAYGLINPYRAVEKAASLR